MANTKIKPVNVFVSSQNTSENFFTETWKALRQFLGIPLLILTFSLLFSFGLILIEQANLQIAVQFRQGLGSYILKNSDATAKVLEIITSGLITQNSIVISILLLVLQRVAGSMGNLIYDQFLGRHCNQFYLGFVSAVLLMALIIRSSIQDQFNPVFSTTIVLILFIIQFFLLIWFLYSAINQMRPETVVKEIDNNIERANAEYQQFLSCCRPGTESDAPVQVIVRAKQNGYLLKLDLDLIKSVLDDRGSATEIICKVRLGDYLSYGMPIFNIKNEHHEETLSLAESLGTAIYIDEEVNTAHTPRYGMKQLESIAWTEGSTARENPETVTIFLNVLKNLLSRWTLEDQQSQQKDEIAFVYQDSVIDALIDTLESLAVISSESLQHRTFAQVLDAVALAYPHLDKACRDRVNLLLERSLSAMGDHVLTQKMTNSFNFMEETLQVNGEKKTARILHKAHKQLADSLGTLTNRSTRMK